MRRALLVLALAGCGSEPPPAVVDQTPGTLAGRVTFVGEVPPARTLQVHKDTEHFGALHGTTVVDVQVGPDRGLAGVVVEVHGIRPGTPWPPPGNPTRVTQQQGRFQPHVLVVPADSAVAFHNRDAVQHEVATGEWSHTQAPDSQLTEHFAHHRRGFRRVHCNIHNWMELWVYAVASPFFATTGPDGTFEIADLPAGNYSATACHPTLGRRRFTFELAAGGRTVHDIRWE